MPEEERLELVSTVEDEFTEPLERLEQSLEDVDDKIRATGGEMDHVEIEIQTTGVAAAMAELEALERQIGRVDEELTGMDLDLSGGGVDMGNGPADGTADGGGITADGGSGTGRSFKPNTPGSAQAMTLGLDADDVEMDLNKMRLKGMGMTALRDDDKTIRELFDEFKEAQFTMGTFHDLFASVLPLFATFVGALPAAIAGVATLGAAALGAAAALGGIAVIGGMGMSLQQTGEVSTEPIAEQFSQMADSFVEAFAPLARQLAPMVQTAFEDIESMFGPLASASQGLTAFRDEFSGLVSAITTGLPSLVSSVLAFSDAAMPLIDGLISFIGEQDLLGYFAAQLQEALPTLVVMGQQLVQLLPAIMELSQGFLIVASAVSIAIGGFAWLINNIPFLGKALGVVAGVTFTAVAATSLYTTVSSALAATVLPNLVRALGSYATGLVVVTYQTWGLAAAVAAVVGLLTLGIGAVVGLTGAFDALSGKIGGARKELEKFANTPSAMRSVEGVGGGYGSSSPSAYGSSGGGGLSTVIKAGDRDQAARQQYSSEYERQQHLDSVFGG